MTLSARKLPIDNIKDDVISTLKQHNTLLLTAPPGAGKSTQLPLWLLALDCLAGEKIYLLQPRRIAAKNIAHNHQAPECKKRCSVKEIGLCHLRGADGIRVLLVFNLIISSYAFSKQVQMRR